MAPTTIVSKKTPVTPLPTKPRQQNQVDLNSHQNQQNLQHQPLQNLSQQNHSLTNASDNSGVQVNIKYPILMLDYTIFFLPNFPITRIDLCKGPFVNYVSILGYLVGQKRAIFAYF